MPSKGFLYDVEQGGGGEGKGTGRCARLRLWANDRKCRTIHIVLAALVLLAAGLCVAYGIKGSLTGEAAASDSNAQQQQWRQLAALPEGSSPLVPGPAEAPSSVSVAANPTDLPTTRVLGSVEEDAGSADARDPSRIEMFDPSEPTDLVPSRMSSQQLLDRMRAVRAEVQDLLDAGGDPTEKLKELQELMLTYLASGGDSEDLDGLDSGVASGVAGPGDGTPAEEIPSAAEATTANPPTADQKDPTVGDLSFELGDSARDFFGTLLGADGYLRRQWNGS